MLPKSLRGERGWPGWAQYVHEAVDRKVVLVPALPGAPKCGVDPFAVCELENEGRFSCCVRVKEKLLEDKVRPFRRPPGEITGYGRVRWVCRKYRFSTSESVCRCCSEPVTIEK